MSKDLQNTVQEGTRKFEDLDGGANIRPCEPNCDDQDYNIESVPAEE